LGKEGIGSDGLGKGGFDCGSALSILGLLLQPRKRGIAVPVSR
jgi:hypothetical protein